MSRRKATRKRKRDAVVRIPKFYATSESDSVSPENQRRAIANFCRMIGDQIKGGGAKNVLPIRALVVTSKDDTLSAGESQERKLFDGLTPRVRQTLEWMLAGDSEKQIGVHMGVSRHTVHMHIRSLYRHFQVNSRGELLAHFVRRDLRKDVKPESQSNE